MRVGVAVIGVGFWGKNHARVYRELEEAKLVAVCDVDEGRARKVAELYGCEWTTDFKALLERKDIEALSICTPTTHHVPLAEAALRDGKHVLVEKPMGGDVKKAKSLVNLARKKGSVIYVGFIERFNPAVRTVRDLVSEGKLGDPVSISSKRVSKWPKRVTDIGVVKDMAIHDIDVFRYVTGLEFEEVFALGGSVGHEHEDHVQVLAKMEGGVGAFIEANWLTPRKIRKLTLTGTEGIARLDYLSQEVVLEDEKGAFSPSLPYREPLKEELSSFLRVVSGKGEPEIKGEDGVLALTVADAILSSLKRGVPVRVGKW